MLKMTVNNEIIQQTANVDLVRKHYYHYTAKNLEQKQK